MTGKKNYMTIEEYEDSVRPAYIPKANEILMSVSDYAKKMGMTTAGVRKQIIQGRIEGVKMGERWRVRVINDDAPNVARMERLQAENEMLKLKLSLIGNILGEGEVQNG